MPELHSPSTDEKYEDPNEVVLVQAEPRTRAEIRSIMQRAGNVALGMAAASILQDDPDMQSVLATRNVAAFFTYLQNREVSQRSIAWITGQSQSEIAEILANRSVVSYDVLARIFDSFGIPRGKVGMATCYCPNCLAP